MAETESAARNYRAEEAKRTLAAVAPEDRQELVGWRTVARLVGHGRRWVYARALEGAWGARRVPGGRAWRFRRSLVDAWLAEVGGRAP